PPPEPRLMLPIAVSYDHRAIDGAQAARFIQYLKDTLQDPMHLLLGI
ncbi:2-oxo acid dehydrogenase subunit E2, partial [bacterium]|nr:2-oxo acid dehydrogenase subunit E2 [bacterium]